VAKVLCVLYDDPVDGYPKSYPRDDLPTVERYPGGQTLPTPKAIDFKPGALLGSVSGELGLRKYLESLGHTFVVTADKEGPNSVFERELPDADIVISQPFWPAYLTAERIARAKNLKLAITAGIGSDHVDLQAAIDHKITVAEVTYSNSISVSEHVVMMILSLVRNYIPSYQWVIKGGWNIADCSERSYDVERMHVGTVAAGRIGLAVLRRLKPFDMHLHYTDRHRLPEAVEKELGLAWHPNVEDLVKVCDVDQRAASPRDRELVQRQASRQDEARGLSREHRTRQDLRLRRDRAGTRKRTARGLRRRRLVPTAGAEGPPVARDAPPRHDAAYFGDLTVGAGALRGRHARDS
jgi:formate dehydrogenase